MGIESGGEFFFHFQKLMGPNQPPKQWVPGLFPGIKRPGHGVDHPLHPALRLKKE